jgi:hypothetical protein
MDTEDLVLYRRWYTDKSTMGELVYKGKLQSVTLEDTSRAVGVKVYGETCIPMGVYDLSLTMSPRFHKMMPLISGVEGFKGIRIHSGNYPEHTLGCILLGLTRGVDKIMQSRLAVSAFMELLGSNDIKKIQIIDTKATQC